MISTRPPAAHGRWIRAGNRILLLPPRQRRGGEMEGEVPGGRPRAATAYTVCDFIDPRIDVEAQYALFGLVRAGTPAPALAMLAAVKAGTLAGIYQEDQLVPARRAVSLGMGWWQAIARFGGPAAQVACVPGPPPLIAFKKSLAGNHPLLGRVLAATFAGCGIATLPPPPPSGKSCTRPPPPIKKIEPPKEVPPSTERPTIRLTSSGITFTFEQGDPPGSDTPRVSNVGKGRLRWRATATQPWITLGRSQGEVPTGGFQEGIPFTVNPAGLGVGTHTGSVEVSGDDATNSPQVYAVTVVVTPRAAVGVCGRGMRPVGGGVVRSDRPGRFRFSGGENVRVVLRNVSLLGAPVTITANGMTDSRVLLPGASVTVPFASFGSRKPVGWFVVVEADGDAAVVGVTLCSDV